MRPFVLAAVLLSCSFAWAQPDGLPLPPAPRPRDELANPVRKKPKPIRGHIDWQGHPAMHYPWRFFRKGLTNKLPRRKLTWEHQFRQTVYTPYLKRSGVRIFVAAAMAAERAETRRQARRLILKQLEYVEAFVRKNPKEFALARTPQEARRILRTTNKMVIVHSIEGMRKLLNGPADARFWSDRGVALVTLIHLWDDEFGGAAIVGSGMMERIINPIGSIHRDHNKRRGLTTKGKNAIVWLADAGMLVDLTHMTPASVDDALAITRRHRISPVVTHGKLRAIRTNDEFAFTWKQIEEVYRQRGFFAIPCSGASLDPEKSRIKVPAGFLRSTIDAYNLHHRTLQRFLEQRVAPRIYGKPFCKLSEAQKTHMSFGWASDWNGWVNHTKPKKNAGNLEFDKIGLAHPGLLPQQWRRVREAGVDLEPLMRSPERFLILWERARARLNRQRPKTTK